MGHTRRPHSPTPATPVEGAGTAALFFISVFSLCSSLFAFLLYFPVFLSFIFVLPVTFVFYCRFFSVFLSFCLFRFFDV